MSSKLPSSPSVEALENLKNMKLEEGGSANPSDSDSDNDSEADDALGGAPPINIYEKDPLKSESFGGWGTADWTSLRVRGPQYHVTREKIRARRPLFKLIRADVVQAKDRIFHIAKEKDFFIDNMYKDKKENKKQQKPENLRVNDPDFVFIVNFLVPGNPSIDVVCYYQRTEFTGGGGDTEEGKENNSTTNNNNNSNNNNKNNNNNSNSSSSSNNSSSSSSTSSQSNASKKSTPKPSSGTSNASNNASPSSSPTSSSADSVTSPTSATSSSSSAYILSSQGLYPKELDQYALKNFDSLLTQYVTGTDEFRNNRLKIIVQLVEGGNWYS